MQKRQSSDEYKCARECVLKEKDEKGKQRLYDTRPNIERENQVFQQQRKPLGLLHIPLSFL
jgi:hypothetical protein